MSVKEIDNITEIDILQFFMEADLIKIEQRCVCDNDMLLVSRGKAMNLVFVGIVRKDVSEEDALDMEAYSKGCGFRLKQSFFFYIIGHGIYYQI